MICLLTEGIHDVYMLINKKKSICSYLCVVDCDDCDAQVVF